MSTPVPVIEMALATRPTEPPTWTDVSAFVEGFSLRRGRQSPFEAVGAGAGTLVLNNADRRFDPTHAAGPYSGTLKSMRRARIRAVWNGAAYDLFTGFVEAWPLRRVDYGHQFVEVPLIDAFGVFALFKVTATRPQERTDERIDAVLSAMNWQTGQAWRLDDAVYGVLGSTTALAPTGDRALDQGQVSVQAATLTRTDALGHLSAVVRTEFGVFFMNKAGAATFYNRTRRLLAGSSGSLATFGDAPQAGELPYADVRLDYDATELWNDINVTREGGVTQNAADADSQLDYYPRSLEWATLGIDDSDSVTLAGYLKNQYARQRLRVRSLVLDPDAGAAWDDAVWPQVLGRELGDVVTVRHTPLGGGSRIEQVSFIEGMAINWRAEGNFWGQPEWVLSPADTTAYWLLGQSGRSELGINATLGI